MELSADQFASLMSVANDMELALENSDPLSRQRCFTQSYYRLCAILGQLAEAEPGEHANLAPEAGPEDSAHRSGSVWKTAMDVALAAGYEVAGPQARQRRREHRRAEEDRISASMERREQDRRQREEDELRRLQLKQLRKENPPWWR
jgi:hypothetical protein